MTSKRRILGPAQRDFLGRAPRDLLFVLCFPLNSPGQANSLARLPRRNPWGRSPRGDVADAGSWQALKRIERPGATWRPGWRRFDEQATAEETFQDEHDGE